MVVTDERCYRLTTAQSHEKTEEIRKKLDDQEELLKQEIASTEQAIAQISLAQSPVGTTNRPSHVADSGDDAEHDLEDLSAQRASLQRTQDVYETLLSDVHFQRTGQKISDIEMSDGGRLLVGKINVKDGSGDIKQDIKNVKASGQGKGMVGVAEGVDIDSFFR